MIAIWQDKFCQLPKFRILQLLEWCKYVFLLHCTYGDTFHQIVFYVLYFISVLSNQPHIYSVRYNQVLEIRISVSSIQKHKYTAFKIAHVFFLTSHIPSRKLDCHDIGKPFSTHASAVVVGYNLHIRWVGMSAFCLSNLCFSWVRLNDDKIAWWGWESYFRMMINTIGSNQHSTHAHQWIISMASYTYSEKSNWA